MVAAFLAAERGHRAWAGVFLALTVLCRLQGARPGPAAGASSCCARTAGARSASLGWLLLGPLAGRGLPGVRRDRDRQPDRVPRRPAGVGSRRARRAPRRTRPSGRRSRPYQGALLLTLLASVFLLVFVRVDRIRPEYCARAGPVHRRGTVERIARGGRADHDAGFPLVWILANRRSIFARRDVADDLGRTVRDRRGAVIRRVLGAVTSGLTLVLPAFNEAERIGPALDELFGYLRRRSDQARDGAPGAAALPDQIDVLVVDDGSTDETVSLVEARPEAAGAIDGVRLHVLRVPHGGKGAAVRAGMLAATATSSSSPMPTWRRRPDQIPLLVGALADHDVALGSRIQPDGSDMRATQPGYRRLLGKAFHLLASIWVVGPVQDTQCGFKGFRRAAAQDLFARQRVTSIVFDVELIYLARRRGYRMAIVPDPLVRQARARACAPARAWPCAWPGTCSGSRSSTAEAAGAPRNGRDGPRRPHPAGADRPADPRPAVVRGGRRSDAGRRRGHARLRLPRLSRGRRTARRRRPALRHVLHRDRWVRAVLLPADVRPAARCRSALLSRRRRRPGLWIGVSLAAFLVGVAILPVSRSVRWWILLLAGLSFPFVYAVKLGQVGPILFFALRRRLALASTTRSGSGERRGRGRDQAAAGAPARLGAPDPSVPGGARRRRRARRRSRLVATRPRGPGAWSDFLTLLIRRSATRSRRSAT